MLLKPLDLAVFHAYSGREGLSQAYAIHPDLIILDIFMPEMDGFGVCSRLREVVNIPILMLTAHTNEKDVLHSFLVGVDDFLKKPFNKDELVARVLLARVGLAVQRLDAHLGHQYGHHACARWRTRRG